ARHHASFKYMALRPLTSYVQLLVISKNLSIGILILRVFVAQMSTHVASWEDKDGWTHGTCPENHNFPNMLCRLSQDLGYPQCPEYVFKDIIENEELVYEVNIYLTPHPERSYVFHESGPTLREAYEKVALLLNDGINMQ